MNIDYFSAIKNRNKQLTAKFMTKIENNNKTALEDLKKLYLLNNGASTQIIGITGFPGSGKSTLINRLIKYYRDKKLTVGVIAIDPTSPFTGGAILGDRLRMDEFTLDQGVFIRSMASRGRLGGLAPATSAFIKILEIYGCDIIIVETVGTGQSEVDIIGMADTVILVTIPETGDRIQALKAGIFEIADIFVVNKSDIKGNDKQVLFISQTLELDKEKYSNKWLPPVVSTNAIDLSLEESGIKKLVDNINEHWNYLQVTGKIFMKRKNKIKTEIFAIAQYFITQELMNKKNGVQINEAIEKINKNELDPYSFVYSFLENLKIDSF
jgi:LAO/AO transport system kinase